MRKIKLPTLSVRAKILLLVSVIFALSGFSILLSPFPLAYYAVDPSIHAHLAIMSVKFIGWMFLSVGLFGSISAAFQKTVLGYGALMFVSTYWLLLYLVSWAETGYWRSIFGAAQYLMFVGVLAVASGVVEIPKKVAKNIEVK